MSVQLVDPGINACVEALGRAGIELHEQAEDGSGKEFLLQGNTYANKELLRRHGGRWSRSRQAWVFDSLEPIRDLATALPATGAPCPGGLADAPTAFEADTPSFAKLRKQAQNSGHRNRLRVRLLETEPQALPDYELLELLLFFSIDVKDTKPLAKELLARYGSLGGVLNAEATQLAEFHDLRKESADIDAYLTYRTSELFQRDRCAEHGALSDEGRRWQTFEHDDANKWEIVRLWRRRETEVLLTAVRELLRRVLREEIQDRPVIGSWTALLDYLQVALAHEPIEQFRVLFLDRKNILIRDELQQRGTVDHTPLYPREIVKRALELGASSIIMVHNHPSGDPTPSRADIEMTKQVVQALGAVGLTVHDHVIVGKNRHTSFKSQRLI
jgi:DNA repair protein RadC